MASYDLYGMFSDFGDRLAAGQRDRDLRGAFSGGLPTKADGTPDYQAMAGTLLKLGRPQEAQTAARLAQSQSDNASTRAYQDATLGIQRGNLDINRQQVGQADQRIALEREQLQRRPPEVQQVFDEQTGQPGMRQFNPQTRQWEQLGGVKSPAATLQAGDKKMIWESQDTITNLDATLQDLARARDLAPKAYSGLGAAARGKVASWSGMGGEGADATVELNQLLSSGAIARMADQLKGATTDRELQRFVEIFADPDAKPELKTRAIQRMELLAQRQKQLLTERIGDIKGGEYSLRPGVRQQMPPGGMPAPTPGMPPPAAAAPAARIGAAFGTLPAQAAPAAPQAAAGAARPTSQAEWQAMAPGTRYVAPDGSERVKQ